MNFFFRVDSSPSIGSGHVHRSLALAEELIARGHDVAFVMTECLESHKKTIRNKGVKLNINKIDKSFKLSEIETIQMDANLTIRSFDKNPPEWVIIDHYGLSFEWEKAVKSFPSKIMVIEDVPSKNHLCDVLLNQNSEDLAGEYQKLLPKSTKILLGPKYALINRNFFLNNKQKIKRKGSFFNKLLIFFTGGDDKGETLKALRGIELLNNDVDVDVVIGVTNKDYDQLSILCKQKKWMLHSDIDYMPMLMNEADLIIGACGSSSWERCLLKKASLVSLMADNQKIVADTLRRSEAVFYLGESNSLASVDYRNGLARITAKSLSEIECNAGKLVDGYGSARVADLLLS